MTILDGRVASQALEAHLAAQVKEMTARGERPPHLKAILVGNNAASEAYVGNKEKKCKKLGYTSTLDRYDADITEDELLDIIAQVNADDTVDGLIVQLPLPEHIDAVRVTDAIDPCKDVDGFHPVNLGKLMLGMEAYRPATPQGIMFLLEHYDVPTEGKHAVILGRSSIVGIPLANMLVNKAPRGNCTVTVCHTRTQNLSEVARSADILVSALGVPGFVTADMVKPGAVVIDVGITRVEDASRERGWRLAGDVDYEQVAPLCSAITPVPGGVGPMTVISLMHNTLMARSCVLKRKARNAHA